MNPSVDIDRAAHPVVGDKFQRGRMTASVVAVTAWGVVYTLSDGRQTARYSQSLRAFRFQVRNSLSVYTTFTPALQPEVH